MRFVFISLFLFLVSCNVKVQKAYKYDFTKYLFHDVVLDTLYVSKIVIEDTDNDSVNIFMYNFPDNNNRKINKGYFAGSYTYLFKNNWFTDEYGIKYKTNITENTSYFSPAFFDEYDSVRITLLRKEFDTVINGIRINKCYKYKVSLQRQETPKFFIFYFDLQRKILVLSYRQILTYISYEKDSIILDSLEKAFKDENIGIIGDKYVVKKSAMQLYEVLYEESVFNKEQLKYLNIKTDKNE